MGVSPTSASARAPTSAMRLSACLGACGIRAGSRALPFRRLSSTSPRTHPSICKLFLRSSSPARLLLPFALRGGVVSAAKAEEGKLISKVEIPAFIPRPDLMDQLLRWAMIEVQESGIAAVGCPCKVTPYMREGTLWGFTVSFLKDGVSGSDVRVAFDEEYAVKHEWIGVGADGFPTLEGNQEQVLGKHFEVRKVDETPVTDDIRSAIRGFCQLLVAAINKYYAFGSCFVDDAT